MPLANIIGVKGVVIEVQNSQFYFILFLIFKELIIWLSMVRRASQKLKREEQLGDGKNVIGESNIYPGSADEDHFVKN